MQREHAFQPLFQDRDLAAVQAFWGRAADYLWLETGRPPDAGTALAFFTGAPPGGDCARACREGLYLGGVLCGIAELARDCPAPGLACITLMVLTPEARGQGLGALWTRRLTGLAREWGAQRLVLQVLAANPRGLAFWQRQGFALEAGDLPGQSGEGPPRRLRMQRWLNAPPGQAGGWSGGRPERRDGDLEGI